MTLPQKRRMRCCGRLARWPMGRCATRFAIICKELAMKLRTVVLARHDGKYVLCVDKDAELGPDEVAGEKEVIHDAAAAHALMQAMKEFNHAGHARHQNPIYAAMCRADAIMAQWGFNSGEVRDEAV